MKTTFLSPEESQPTPTPKTALHLTDKAGTRGDRATQAPVPGFVGGDPSVCVPQSLPTGGRHAGDLSASA